MDDFFRLPIRLQTERVWRTYTGGRHLDRLHGQAEAPGDHYPEEWLMSLVAARSSQPDPDSTAGLSKIAATGQTLKSLIELNSPELLGRYRQRTGRQTVDVLTKLIDTDERLSIQVHPDRAAAQALFHSAFGKTECWHILGVRSIDGQTPSLYIGFRPGITRAHWQQLFADQDIPGMLGCLHRFDVQPGDTFLVPGGIPHAIGAGCLLAEIQEPTDFTIRTERTTPAGLKIDDGLCHQGLGFERMFDCFHYEVLSCAETDRRCHIASGQLAASAEAVVTEVVGYRDTPYFAMSKINVLREYIIQSDGLFSGLFILSGHGRLQTGQAVETISPGDQFFLPAAMPAAQLLSAGPEPILALRYWGPDC